MSRAHREALATIIYGIETRKGFIVCTGEVGTGKTTVVRAFFDQARAEAFKIIYLFTPQVRPARHGDLHLPRARRSPSPRASSPRCRGCS